MDIQCPPCKSFRIAETGKESALYGDNFDLVDGNVKRASSSGLKRRYCGFTLMQMQELEQQALIYKYIEAGIPIPCHLIMPIWKSVATSIRYQYFPNLLGHNNALVCEHNKTSSLEAEPGRCRRTDGKKWRCSKEVVSGQKYCQRHMHRGRLHRSRKPVETTATTTLQNPNANSVIAKDNSDTSLSISLLNH